MKKVLDFLGGNVIGRKGYRLRENIIKKYFLFIFASFIFTTYSQESFHDFYWDIFIKHKFNRVEQYTTAGANYKGFLENGSHVTYLTKNIRSRKKIYSVVYKEFLEENGFPKYKDTIIKYFNDFDWLYYNKNGEVFKRISCFSQPQRISSFDTTYYEYDLKGNCVVKKENFQVIAFIKLNDMGYSVKKIISEYSFNNNKRITNVLETYYDDMDSILIIYRISYVYNELGLPISICYELKKSLQSEWEFNFENKYTYFPTKSKH